MDSLVVWADELATGTSNAAAFGYTQNTFFFINNENENENEKDEEKGWRKRMKKKDEEKG